MDKAEIERIYQSAPVQEQKKLGRAGIVRRHFDRERQKRVERLAGRMVLLKKSLTPRQEFVLDRQIDTLRDEIDALTRELLAWETSRPTYFESMEETHGLHDPLDQFAD